MKLTSTQVEVLEERFRNLDSETRRKVLASAGLRLAKPEIERSRTMSDTNNDSDVRTTVLMISASQIKSLRSPSCKDWPDVDIDNLVPEPIPLRMFLDTNHGPSNLLLSQRTWIVNEYIDLVLGLHGQSFNYCIRTRHEHKNLLEYLTRVVDAVEQGTELPCTIGTCC